MSTIYTRHSANLQRDLSDLVIDQMDFFHTLPQVKLLDELGKYTQAKKKKKRKEKKGKCTLTFFFT